MALSDFDSEKFFLGSLCKRLHDYDGSGRSLRRLSIRSQACVECEKFIKSQQRGGKKRGLFHPNRKDPFQPSKKEPFDSSLFFLGNLCKGGHEFGNTGKTLRRLIHNGCPECSKLSRRAQIQRDLERGYKLGRKQLQATHFDLINNDPINCTRCGCSTIYRSQPLVYKDGETGHKFICQGCLRYFSWRYGYPKGIKGKIEREKRAYEFNAKESVPKEVVPTFRNSILIEWDILRSLKASPKTLKAIAQDVGESEVICKSILTELLYEDFSPIIYSDGVYEFVSHS